MLAIEDITCLGQGLADHRGCEHDLELHRRGDSSVAFARKMSAMRGPLALGRVLRTLRW